MKPFTATDHRRVATGNSFGAHADESHAYQAVQNARLRLPEQTIGSVFLFLTTGYAQQPQAAIKQAVTAAGTPLVSGACAVSIVTEDEWLFDVEGAVAMVFPQDYCWHPLALARHAAAAIQSSLCISSPNAVRIAINSVAQQQFGVVVSDNYGHGPFSVWQSGRIEEQEYCHSVFHNGHAGEHQQTAKPVHYVGLASGVVQLSPTQQINITDASHIVQLGEQSASENLFSNLPAALHARCRRHPSSILAAVSNSPAPCGLAGNDFTLLHLMDIDEQQGRIQLSAEVKAGRHLFWALRDPQQAQKTLRDELLQARAALQNEPQFALFFPNISRGAEFYEGRDYELELFKEIFPGLPMVGLYGHAEIFPHANNTAIHHHATLFAIYC